MIGTTSRTAWTPTQAGGRGARSPILVTSVTKDLTRIELVGELTGESSRVLIGALRERLEAADSPRVRIDLKRVAFLDGRGVAALVVARKMAAHASVDMRLEHPSPVTRRVLEICGLGDLMVDAPTA